MITSAWITVLPPRMMLVVPMIWERRETLLPVSWFCVKEWNFKGGEQAYGFDVFALCGLFGGHGWGMAS